MVFLFVDLVISRGPKLRLEYNMTRVVVLRLSSPGTGFMCKGFLKGLFPGKARKREEKQGRAGEGLKQVCKPRQNPTEGLKPDATGN